VQEQRHPGQRRDAGRGVRRGERDVVDQLLARELARGAVEPLRGEHVEELGEPAAHHLVGDALDELRGAGVDAERRRAGCPEALGVGIALDPRDDRVAERPQGAALAVA
jgi:hypothetical protein